MVMTALYFVGYLLICVFILSFLYWVIEKFCPEAGKKFAFAILGFIGLCLAVFLILGLMGQGPLSPLLLPHRG